jgi:hypothetical protein
MRTERGSKGCLCTAAAAGAVAARRSRQVAVARPAASIYALAPVATPETAAHATAYRRLRAKRSCRLRRKDELPPSHALREAARCMMAGRTHVGVLMDSIGTVALERRRIPPVDDLH